MERRMVPVSGVCLCVLLFVASANVVSSLDIRFCREPMGMENGLIPDSALSSTSSFASQLGPQHARLNIDRSGGAWCPKQQIAENVNEYLQIEVSERAGLSVITGISTQGRFGKGQGQEYMEQFRIEYWRPELAVWRPYRRWDRSEIFDGNSDTNTVVHHDLNPAIVAKRVRVIPYGIYPRTVCMRVELYGCKWSENISSYSIPTGHAWSDALVVDDTSYDGFKESGGSMWVGGLGILTDGQYGLDNFKLDIGARKGHGWVGWHNDSTGRPIEMLFRFDSLRNFSAIHIHANNYFTQQVQVFSRATLSFSVGGRKFGGSFSYWYMEDLALQNSRNVTISVPHTLARFVKIELFFSARWMMLSEVTFDSEMVDGAMQDELHALIEKEETEEENIDEVNLEANLTNQPTPVSGVYTESAPTHGYFEAVVGALSAVMLLLIFAIVLIILMNHRKKIIQENLTDVFRPPFDAADKVGTLDASETKDVVGRADNDPRIIPNNPKYIHTANEPRFFVNPNESDYSSATRPTGSSESVVHFNSLRTNHIPPRHQIVGPSKQFPRVATDPISRKSAGKMINGKSSLLEIPTWNIRPLGDPVAYENSATSRRSSHSVPEIPRHNLKLVEWLGSSSYGEAYVCHISSNSDYKNLSKQQPVVVRGGPVRDPKSFQAEIKLLASIQHPNLISLLAYSNSNGIGWMIFECPVYGDLNSYLKQQPNEISTRNVLKLAVQISWACRYLEERGLVHTDLATRNCLIGPELMVKVSDMAIVSSVFKEHYGEVRGRKNLPLRWLPWETLVLDKFNEKSGSWMLAVTIWELATGARERPYSTMNDAQVILNADHFYYSDGKQVILPPPNGRPIRLYNWMTTCWSREYSERPTFAESSYFLEQLSACY